MQATYWKYLLNVSSLGIIWFSLTTLESFSSLALNKFIRGLFRILLNIKMVRFTKIVNSWKPLSIFTKKSILDVWKGSKIFVSLFYFTLFTLVASYQWPHQRLRVIVVFLEILRNRRCGSYFKLLFQVNKRRKPQEIFSYACNLLKMDASSTDFQQCFKKYLPRNPVNTSRSV